MDETRTRQRVAGLDLVFPEAAKELRYYRRKTRKLLVEAGFDLDTAERFAFIVANEFYEIFSHRGPLTALITRTVQDQNGAHIREAIVAGLVVDPNANP